MFGYLDMDLCYVFNCGIKEGGIGDWGGMGGGPWPNTVTMQVLARKELIVTLHVCVRKIASDNSQAL